jgi:hypothetical protein
MTSRALLVLLVLALVGTRVFSEDLNEGSKPYTPTRLEWLAVEMNSVMRVSLLEKDYSLDFLPNDKEDTILIYVRYLPSVNREAVNMQIDTARKMIEIYAKSHRWSSWLKIQEDVKMTTLNK